MAAPAQNRIRSMLDVEADPNSFDKRVHFFDASGRLAKTSHYTLYVIEGEQYFERPVNSGNLWYGNNQPAGRMERDERGGRTLSLGVPHVAFTAPLEGDELLHYQLESEKHRNAGLQAKVDQQQEQLDAIMRELAQIRAERAPAPVPQAAPKPLSEALAVPAAPKLKKE